QWTFFRNPLRPWFRHKKTSEFRRTFREGLCLHKGTRGGTHFSAAKVVGQKASYRGAQPGRGNQFPEALVHNTARPVVIETHSRQSGCEGLEQGQSITLVPRGEHVEVGKREEGLLAGSGHVTRKHHASPAQPRGQGLEPVQEPAALHVRRVPTNKQP